MYDERSGSPRVEKYQFLDKESLARKSLVIRRESKLWERKQSFKSTQNVLLNMLLVQQPPSTPYHPPIHPQYQRRNTYTHNNTSNKSHNKYSYLLDEIKQLKKLLLENQNISQLQQQQQQEVNSNCIDNDIDQIKEYEKYFPKNNIKMVLQCNKVLREKMKREWLQEEYEEWRQNIKYSNNGGRVVSQKDKVMPIDHPSPSHSRQHFHHKAHFTLKHSTTSSTQFDKHDIQNMLNQLKTHNSKKTSLT